MSEKKEVKETKSNKEQQEVNNKLFVEAFKNAKKKSKG